jgi:hypothetical protein
LSDNAHVSQGYNESPETYVQLKAAYDQAVKEKQEYFLYRNRVVLVEYAKYLLEHLEQKLEIQHT